MTHYFLLYLAEATACLGVFSLAYRLVFSRLMHFQWNRFYLVSIVLLSVLIPLVHLPLSFHDFLPVSAPEPPSFQTDSYTPQKLALPAQTPITPTRFVLNQTDSIVIDYGFIPPLLLVLYLVGLSYKAFRFGRNLLAVYQLVRAHPQSAGAGYRLVYTSQAVPAFSFLHFIFLGREHHQLSPEELAQVMRHERVHVEQRHTLDLLLFEVMAVLFWFNPLVGYLKKSLQEVHEYLADAIVTKETEDHRLYQKLLLKLAMQSAHPAMASSFSARQLKKRILMLTRTPANPRQKLWFALAFPLLSLLVVGCSLLRLDAEIKPSETKPSLSGANTWVGKVTWRGNTLYGEEELNRALNLREGDVYEEDDLNRRLYNSPKTSDVASLYMNKGYSSFDAQVKATPAPNNRVNLEMYVFEGQQVKIGQLLFHGNSQVPRSDVLRLINISPGELYDRSKFMKSRWALINSDLFGAVDVRQIPHLEQGTLDLEYSLRKPISGILFYKEIEAGSFLINGQPIKNNSIKIGAKGIISIHVEDQKLKTLLEENDPAHLTMELKRRNSEAPLFTKSWKDYRDLGNFDISEVLSHSQPGDFLIFSLANKKFGTGIFLPVR